MMAIPRMLHYIWLGENPMHPLMREWRKRWAALHPGWEMKTWGKVPGLPTHLLASGDELVECRHPSYLASCPTHAKRSDVWRYEILEQQGGVYLDTDFEPIKCIEPPIEGAAAFAGLCRTILQWSADCPEKRKLEVGCSIMGAAPHHPWLREIVSRIPTRDPVRKLSLAFPFLTEITARHPDVLLLEPEIFYPVPWDRYARTSRGVFKKTDEADLLRGEALEKAALEALEKDGILAWDPSERLPESSRAAHRWSSTWFAEGLRPLQEIK
jgi:hypothetical protein